MNSKIDYLLNIGIVKLFIFSPLVILLISCAAQENKENSEKHQNRLAQASSPYLKEHADNPVDWYEWGTEALERATREGKPLIISIGYASCHWCHVMERESFMDTAVARLMNENFVSIKIDREERPDIDQIYMNAAQLISGKGGWPLNAFALPDGKPFYAATYFPKEQWKKILNQILAAYKKDNGNVLKQAESLTKGIQQYEVITIPVDSVASYNHKIYEDIFPSLETVIDYKSGGFSGAPKFPMPAVWEFLLQHHYLTGNKKALDAVVITLDEMANGGIYDQLAGGFARYSTDADWKVPHFEKMLYDNGQLVCLYAHTYQVTKDQKYADVITKTLDFIKSDLTNPDGGFYSSLNADSEGEEGKYYVWTKSEIENVLEKKAAELFIEYYQVTDVGNWEDSKNILFVKDKIEVVAKSHLITTEELAKIILEAEAILLKERKKRVSPSLDDKVLTSWNALMLDGYLGAYFALGKSEYLQIALVNARFLEKNMMRPGGQLWRNHKDGKSSIDAFLDDYALLAKAYVRLYEATFDIHWLELARSITDYATDHFRDSRSGMFYYTSDDSEFMVARKMELTDNVIPSSNSVMAEVLYRLGEYFDQDEYRNFSKAMLSQVSKDVATSGAYYANWARLMGLVTFESFDVAIMGEDTMEKRQQLLSHY
ncbi:MAG: thioredoxin domain-containing protein, partial [Bacteroidia bacterium]|nr:thioredoxin domain-containing protein [Bacteroidia bacterium]